MKKISLGGKHGKGKFALVDDEDFENLKKYIWNCDIRGYVTTTLPRRGGKQPYLLMHRIIMNTPKGLDTDHRNGDRLNNQKSNLRICTRSQNKMNMGARRDNKLGVKGVYVQKYTFNGRTREYINAKIMLNGKHIFLGRFSTVKLASEAYNKKAKELFGEFAGLNSI